METFVVDTHALAWFLAEDERLSATALQILSAAEAGETQVLISTLVLAELTYIAQRQRVPVTIETALARIEAGDGFAVVPFDSSCFQAMLNLPEDWDIHDRIIAATANLYDAQLITRDEMLSASGTVTVVW
ncbi:type II toxin-antitoxin system VapC family toxin [Nodosilinea sp. PGN35]|uniref:type II toxin-antitoxin system VapC family toxin n=1 Tax=Nodosilinea sp. PGN35 TaxID=3020489 RepID=UPI0023B2A37D|nr:PIN domain-containing protein [Nodosilinea sp. TSF1-S3]MDF0364760.1 PIN domain-containing protein [Nodosilinea sp. TSF1-S3]